MKMMPTWLVFPEFPGAHTHGTTHVEAVKNGQQVLALLVQTFEQEGKSLPEPGQYRYALA